MVALIFAALLTLSGCGSDLDYLTKDGRRESLENKVSFSMLTTEGRRIQVGSADRPTVVFFAGELCTTCISEIVKINAYLQSAPVSRVNLYTVLVGIDEAFIEDAQYFKEDHGMSWTVGVDPDASQLKKYCEKNEVPCVIVQLPELGIVYRKHGENPLDRIFSLTGPWKD